MFLKRLEIYTMFPPTPIMVEVMVKIMVELLSVLALATKQMKESRFSRCKVRYTGCFSMCRRAIREEAIGGS